MINLSADGATKRDVDGIFGFISGGIARMGRGERRMIGDAIRRGFQENFTHQREGSGAPWRPLALVTQAERRRKGFAGARPILVRTGAYRDALVNPNNPNHYSATGPLVAGLWFEEGAEGILVSYHEGGTRRIPARPATILSAGAKDALGRVIDHVLERMERRAIP